MKKQYLTSNRGRLHVLASVVLAAAVGVALGSVSHVVVGLLAGAACAAVLGALGYGLFILEVRTNSLVRGPQRDHGTRAGSTAAAAGSRATTGPITTAGRGAARQVTDGNDERTLRRLTTELPAQPVRVAAVAPADLTVGVPADEVVTMVPGYASAELQTGTYRALVVDRQALAQGPWAGAESAVGVDLLLQLQELVELARRRRIPVLLLDAPLVADVGSGDVRALGDLVLPLPPSDYPPEGAPCSPLLATLQRIGAERFLPVEPAPAEEPAAPRVTAGSARG